VGVGGTDTTGVEVTAENVVMDIAVEETVNVMEMVLVMEMEVIEMGMEDIEMGMEDIETVKGPIDQREELVLCHNRSPGTTHPWLEEGLLQSLQKVSVLSQFWKHVTMYNVCTSLPN